MGVSDDLRTLGAFLDKQKWPHRAQICLTAAAEFDIMTAQVANAATTSAQQNAELAQQATTITALQAQLAAATISPLSLVMMGTHLYLFPTIAAAQAFMAANSTQTPVEMDATDFTWNPPAT